MASLVQLTEASVRDGNHDLAWASPRAAIKYASRPEESYDT